MCSGIMYYCVDGVKVDCVATKRNDRGSEVACGGVRGSMVESVYVLTSGPLEIIDAVIDVKYSGVLALH